ncbi:MAG TPA: helix-turn-helix domain-containing protein, partial [Polyangiaceae bacterium]
MKTPWHRPAPDATKVETDDDDFVTIDKWPRDVFRPHFHDVDFNWLVPLRAGRIVVSVEGEEITFDGEHWMCVFPRTPHAVVHVSDDGEVLSLFVHESAFAKAWGDRALGKRFIVGGEGTVARGLALAWAEERFTKKNDEHLEAYLARWLLRHYGAPIEASLAVTLRAAFGADGARLADLFETHLADQPFPWSDLARTLRTSTRTLQRRFERATGRSPSATLQQLRLERARDLLRDPSRSVGDVAMA